MARVFKLRYWSFHFIYFNSALSNKTDLLVPVIISIFLYIGIASFWACCSYRHAWKPSDQEQIDTGFGFFIDWLCASKHQKYCCIFMLTAEGALFTMLGDWEYSLKSVRYSSENILSFVRSGIACYIDKYCRLYRVPHADNIEHFNIMNLPLRSLWLFFVMELQSGNTYLSECCICMYRRFRHKYD